MSQRGILYGIVSCLGTAWRYAKREGYHWTDADGTLYTWADTREAAVLRSAVRLMETLENARAAAQVERTSTCERRTVAEQEDLQNWFIHNARMKQHGPNLKRKKKERYYYA